MKSRQIFEIRASLLQITEVLTEVLREAEREENSGEFTDDVAVLRFTPRTSNCLKRRDINTIGELLNRSVADLLDIPNLGSKSIDDIEHRLALFGLHLKYSQECQDRPSCGLPGHNKVP